jgi:hypothetical protein
VRLIDPLVVDAIGAYLRFEGGVGCLPPGVGHAAVDSLLEAVGLQTCLSLLDPFGEEGQVAAALAGAGLRVRVGLRDRAHQHCALLADFYSAVKGRGSLEAIVSAPWPPLLDFFLPLAVLHATVVTCCLVPLSYVCDSHAPRRGWLARLRAERRLCFVHPRDPDAASRQVSGCVWLVVLASPSAASLLRQSGPRVTVL